MRAIRLVVFAEARHRWRAWLALGLLVAVVGGVVMTASAAARRTNSAFPRYAARYGYDTVLYGIGPIRGLASQPEVRRSISVPVLLNGQPTCAGCAPIDVNNFSTEVLTPEARQHVVKLVSGRLPTKQNEVLASFTFAEDDHVHIGTVIRLPFFAPSQRTAVLKSAPNLEPAGPTANFTVVGIEAAMFEFPSGGQPSADIWTTAAFARGVAHETVPFYQYLVSLRPGALNRARFQQSTTALGAVGSADEDVVKSEIETAIHPQVVGWWVLAAIAAVAGLFALAQAFARQTRAASQSHPALSAVGMSANQLLAVTLARAMAIGVVGAAGAVLLTLALSPLTPVGEARTAEISPGFSLDPRVLGLGVAAIVMASLVVALWPAWRWSRRRAVDEAPQSASAIVRWLSSAGAGPTMLIGVRRAIERGGRRDPVPVVSALAGTVLAVLALSATAVFGTSLSSLTATPARYGQRFDASFSPNFATPGELTRLHHQLLGDQRIAAVTEGASAEVVIDGHSVDAIAGKSLKGPVLLTSVGGRLPGGPHEIGLGQTTMRELGVSIGSTVEVKVANAVGRLHTLAFKVVGSVVFPTDFGVGGLGNGAVFTLGGLSGAQCPGGPGRTTCLAKSLQNDQGAVLVAGDPNARGRAAIASYERRYSDIVSIPTVPTNLVNFAEVVNFPLIVGVVLALFGASTLLHMLVVSTARRRSETGLLKVLGFVRSQVTAAVAWQATTTALVGLVIGIPLGIATGAAVWRQFASGLGVVPNTVVAASVLALVGVATIVIANLLALGPAVVSSRARPAELLRID